MVRSGGWGYALGELGLLVIGEGGLPGAEWTCA